MAAVKNDHIFETNAYTRSAQGREWTSKMNIKYKIIIFIHFQGREWTLKPNFWQPKMAFHYEESRKYPWIFGSFSMIIFNKIKQLQTTFFDDQKWPSTMRSLGNTPEFSVHLAWSFSRAAMNVRSNFLIKNSVSKTKLLKEIATNNFKIA